MKKNKPVRVAFLIFSLQAGGAERNILNIVRYSKNANIKPIVIAIKDINEYKKEYQSESKYIISLLQNRKISLFLKPYRLFEVFIKTLWITYNNKIDVLIAGSEHLPFYLAVAAAILLRKKSILIVGNNIEAEEKLRNKLVQKINYFLFKLSFKLTSRIICVSKGLAESVKNVYKIPPHKITVIYNGVDIKRIHKLAKLPLTDHYKKIFAGNYIISTLGRLAYKKGYNHLIRSFSIVKKNLNNVKLIIIGKGEAENDLRKIIKSLGLEKDVLILKLQSPDQYKFLKNSDLFVFTSYYEGFGNVIVEAMACGLPVISSDCRFGPREILNISTNYKDINKNPIYGKYGILTPLLSQNTHNSLRQKKSVFAYEIIKLIENIEMSNGYKRLSVERARYFNLSIMIEKYLSIIKM